MKKKQKQDAAPPPSTAAVAAATTTTTDIKSLIHDQALFFDKLVELIPAKFYISNDDADSKPWFQGLSKAAKAYAKQQTRENIKKARRDRLDPEKSQTTTLDILKQNIEKENAKNSDSEDDDDDDDDDEVEDDDEEIEMNPIMDFDGEEGENNNVGKKSDSSVTYEELQQRLHWKLEALRGNRGQGKRAMMMSERREMPDKKRKRSDDFGSNKSNGGRSRDKDGDREGKVGKSGKDIEKEVTEASKGIAFGKVKLGEDAEVFGAKKKVRKGSKAVELERAKKLKEAMQDPEKGEVVAKKHSWHAATSRAMGVKVHDDPTKLKESIRKEKKRHEKNVGKWKERIESREQLRGEKQKKRAGNIQDRINDKKQRKIAKREKKLMRPGFEGRKEGYIGGGD